MTAYDMNNHAPRRSQNNLPKPEYQGVNISFTPRCLILIWNKRISITIKIKYKSDWMKGMWLENNKKIEKSIPVSLGNIHKVRIIDKSEKGDGIAKIKNFIIFIPNVDIGDLVKIKIVQIKRNCAIGVKAQKSDKTSLPFLLTKGPLNPPSFKIDTEGDLIHISPWSSSPKYYPTSRHGTRRGRCKECRGSLIWDSKHNSSFCEECGLEG